HQAPPVQKLRVFSSVSDPEAGEQAENVIPECLYDIEWDLKGDKPYWFGAAVPAYLSVFGQNETSNPLYWRIIDLSFAGTVKVFSVAEINVLNKTFSSSLKKFDILGSDIDAVLSVLSQVSPMQIVNVCKAVQMGGPLGGLQTLHQFLEDIDDGQSEDDESHAFFTSSPDAGNEINISETLRRIIDSVDLQAQRFGRLTADILYAMNIFKSIGEPVCKATRDCRQIASETSGGYHLDGMITSKHNTSEQGFGHEFSDVERVGANLNPGNKLQTDSLKLSKTLRDIETTCGGYMPTEAADAMQIIRMCGIRATGFTDQSSVLVYAGGGFFIRKVVSDFAVPTHERDLGMTVTVIREMLKMKNLLTSTVQNFERIKCRCVSTEASGSVRHNDKKEITTPDKQVKKGEVK
ncbi:hypothetical protein HDU80_001211, partial [Chytriomyces hyalinus]